jgi:uncharacterized protein
MVVSWMMVEQVGSENPSTARAGLLPRGTAWTSRWGGRRVNPEPAAPLTGGVVALQAGCWIVKEAMMSQDDVQVIRDAYDAFNRGDIPAVLTAMDQQIEWIEPGGGRAPSGTFRGPDSVANDVFATVPQNFEQFSAQPDQFIDAGAHVVVTGRFDGTAKSGKELHTPFVHVWKMRGGQALHFQNFVDAAEWAEGWD